MTPLCSDNDAYDGDKIAWTNVFNVYNDQGQLDGLRQRVYFTLENANGAYVRLTQADPDTALNYSLRVFRARPVVLVHGINANPRSSSDPNTTFADMRDKLGLMANVYPCVCYDFPWNSEKDFEGETGFMDYVGLNENSKGTLYGFVADSYKKHGESIPANIVAHSMGGMIVRYQLPKSGFAVMVNQVLFIDSPQYGSELANFVIDIWPQYVKTYNPMLTRLMDSWGTGRINYLHLSRAGETVWDMHHNVALTIPAQHVAFTIGTQGDYLEAMFRSIMFGYDAYRRGLRRGDGIVPAGSQNMQNLDSAIEAVYLDHNHLSCQRLTLDDMNSCRTLYDLIKRRMNEQ